MPALILLLLILIPVAIFCLVAFLVNVSSRSDSDSDVKASTSTAGTMYSTMPSLANKPKSAAKADEQSYYQFFSPTPVACAFCGCENETGLASCQVCGKSL